MGILLVGDAVALACAAALAVRKSDVYTASTQLFIASAVSTDDPEDCYQRNLIAAGRVRSYVTLASGDVVADRVAEALGSDIDASVSVSIVPDTVVILVSASGADPDQVAEVAAAYADVLPAVIDEVEQVNDSPAQIRATVIDEADVPGAPDPELVVHAVRRRRDPRARPRLHDRHGA